MAKRRKSTLGRWFVVAMLIGMVFGWMHYRQRNRTSDHGPNAPATDQVLLPEPGPEPGPQAAPVVPPGQPRSETAVPSPAPASELKKIPPIVTMPVPEEPRFALEKAVPAGAAIIPGEVKAYATRRAVGLSIPFKGDSDSNAAGFVDWRQTAEGEWRPGVDLTFDHDSKIAHASIWPLDPGTSIEYRLSFKDPDHPEPLRLQGRAALRPRIAAVQGGRTIYVSSRARGTGSGSRRSPFSSVKAALKDLRPGDMVRVLPGHYTETVVFGPELQGRADAPIVLQGTAGVVFDASTEIPTGAAWTDEGQGVFAIKTSIAHGLVLQDGRRMYGYAKREAFDQSKVKPARVYFYDREAGRLLIRTGDAQPASRHVYTCAGQANAFRFEGASHVILADVEIRHTAAFAISIAAGSGNSIINNTLTNCAGGLRLQNSAVDNTAIHNNRLVQKGFEDFGWRELMDMHWEFPRDGIVVWSGRGTSIIGNHISGHQNNISLEPSPRVRGTARNTAFNRDLDVMFNILMNCGDDAIEADYGGVNMRIHGNRIRNSNSGVSVAPCVRGPVYITRNDFTFRTLMFKFGINKPDSHGVSYAYHNSGYALTKGNTMGIYLNKNLPTTNKHFKNNIIYVTGTDLALALRPGNFFDGNCWFSDSKVIKFNWQEAWLRSLGALRQASGQAGASLYADPRLRAVPGLTATPVPNYALSRVAGPGIVTDPQASDFGLGAGSPCIDAGLPIRGINEDFKGRAPDIGAHEARTTGPQGEAKMAPKEVEAEPNMPRRGADQKPGPRVWAIGEGLRICPVKGKAFEDNAKQTPGAVQGEYSKKNLIWDQALATISLKGAANEMLAFQLIIEGAGLQDIDVNVEALKGPGGEIPAGNMQLFRAFYVNVHQPVDAKRSNFPLEKGWYPDPLVPLDTPRIGAPFAIDGSNFGGGKPAAINNQTVWVDLWIPKKLPPGTYSGTLVVASSKGDTALKMKVEVFGFELPDENSTIMDLLCYKQFAKFYDRTQRNRVYAMAQRHRVTIATNKPFTYYEPELMPKDGKLVWEGFDREYGEAITGAITRDGYRAGMRITHFILPFEGQLNRPDKGEAHKGYNWPIPSPTKNDRKEIDFTPAYVADLTKYLKQADDHFGKKYPGTKLVVFQNVLDEAAFHKDDKDLAFAQLRSIQGYLKVFRDAKLKNILYRFDIGSGFAKSRYDLDGDGKNEGSRDVVDALPGIDIWNINGMRIDLPALQPAIADGAEVWFYNGYEPRVGPTVIGGEGVGSRTWPWIQFNSDMQGTSLWHFENGVENKPWERGGAGKNNPHAGFAFLIYQGKDIGFEDRVFSSVRLKGFRRGLQDYEYFMLLTQKDGNDKRAKALSAQAVRHTIMQELPVEDIQDDVVGEIAEFQVAGDARHWSHNPEDFEKVRYAVGKLITE